MWRYFIENLKLRNQRLAVMKLTSSSMTPALPKLETNRRQFMKAAVVAGSSYVVLQQPAFSATTAAGSKDGEFQYEFTRTEEEWRSMFDDETYKILREADTEWPQSSELWDDYRDGDFACSGCGLHNYESVWRTELDKGWVFFTQSVPNSLLMGIDGKPPSGMADDNALPATIEVHCRRCGSHMGHVVMIGGQVLHCINGRSLEFTPA